MPYANPYNCGYSGRLYCATNAHYRDGYSPIVILTGDFTDKGLVAIMVYVKHCQIKISESLDKVLFYDEDKISQYGEIALKNIVDYLFDVPDLSERYDDLRIALDHFGDSRSARDIELNDSATIKVNRTFSNFKTSEIEGRFALMPPEYQKYKNLEDWPVLFLMRVFPLIYHHFYRAAGNGLSFKSAKKEGIYQYRKQKAMEEAYKSHRQKTKTAPAPGQQPRPRLHRDQEPHLESEDLPDAIASYREQITRRTRSEQERRADLLYRPRPAQPESTRGHSSVTIPLELDSVMDSISAHENSIRAVLHLDPDRGITDQITAKRIAETHEVLITRKPLPDANLNNERSLRSASPRPGSSPAVRKAIRLPCRGRDPNLVYREEMSTIRRFFRIPEEVPLEGLVELRLVDTETLEVSYDPLNSAHHLDRSSIRMANNNETVFSKIGRTISQVVSEVEPLLRLRDSIPNEDSIYEYYEVGETDSTVVFRKRAQTDLTISKDGRTFTQVLNECRGVISINFDLPLSPDANLFDYFEIIDMESSVRFSRRTPEETNRLLEMRSALRYALGRDREEQMAMRPEDRGIRIPDEPIAAYSNRDGIASTLFNADFRSFEDRILRANLGIDPAIQPSNPVPVVDSLSAIESAPVPEPVVNQAVSNAEVRSRLERLVDESVEESEEDYDDDYDEEDYEGI